MLLRSLRCCHIIDTTNFSFAAPQSVVKRDSVEAARSLLRQRFRAVAYGGDLWIYGQALRHGIDDLHNGGALSAEE